MEIKETNMIHAAIACAGGNAAVADLFGLTVQAVGAWSRNKIVPAPYIHPLVRQGGYLIGGDKILAYISKHHPKVAEA